MGTLLFLGCVVLVAVVLIWFIGRSSRRKNRPAASASRHERHHQPIYEHRAGSLSRLHSHPSHTPAGRDIWQSHRARAGAERWQAGGSVTATHLRTDEEQDADGQDQVAMGVIEYVPTEVPRTGDKKA